MSDWIDRISALNADDRQRLAKLLGVTKPMLVAFIEGTTQDDLKAWVGEKLPRYKVPDRIVALQALPRLPNGKIDRRSLLDYLPSAMPARRESAGDIADGTERELQDIWCNLLGLEHIEADDDFFELGGDSLVVIRMVSMARQKGLRIDPADIADNPTIRKLAQVSRKQEVEAQVGGVSEAPLLPIQAWHLRRGLPTPEHWNQAVRLGLKKPVNEEILRQCFDALVDRHPGLGVRLDGERQLAGGEIEIGRRTFSLDGPLIRAELFEDHLILEAHHLVIDAVSWGVLLGDLDLLLEALCRGRDGGGLEPAVSALDWATEVARYARSPSAREDIAPWLEMEAAEPPRDAGTEDQAAMLDSVLDADLSAKLLGPANARFNSEPRDLLIWGLAEAFAELSGRSKCRIDIEGHGRRPHFSKTDLSRTVGWLTEYFPADIELIGGGIERGKHVKENLRRVATRGAAFGAVRYLGEDLTVSKALAARQRTEVLFNYLGHASEAGYSTFDVEEILTEDMRAPGNSRSHLFEFNITVRDGQFHIALTHGHARQTRNEAKELLDAFVGHLAGVAELCTGGDSVGFTPTDFPEAGMTQDELDRFLDEL